MEDEINRTDTQINPLEFEFFLILSFLEEILEEIREVK